MPARHRDALAPLLAAVPHAILRTSPAEPASTLERVVAGERILYHLDLVDADQLAASTRQAVMARAHPTPRPPPLAAAARWTGPARWVRPAPRRIRLA